MATGTTSTSTVVPARVGQGGASRTRRSPRARGRRGGSARAGRAAGRTGPSDRAAPTTAGARCSPGSTSSVPRSMRGLAGTSPRASVEHHAGRGGGHLLQRLVDGGERRADPLGDGQVVVADDRQVLGDRAGPSSRAARMTPSAWKSEPGEDRGGPVGPVEQVHAVRVAAADEEVAVPDQRRVDRDAGLVERGAVAVDAGAAAQHVDRAGDDGDPPVARARAGAGSRPGRRPSCWTRRSARPAGCSPAVSTTTNGIDRRLQLPALRPGRGRESTRITPSGRRASTSSSHSCARPVRAAELGEHHAHALGGRRRTRRP